MNIITWHYTLHITQNIEQQVCSIVVFYSTHHHITLHNITLLGSRIVELYSIFSEASTVQCTTAMLKLQALSRISVVIYKYTHKYIQLSLFTELGLIQSISRNDHCLSVRLFVCPLQKPIFKRLITPINKGPRTKKSISKIFF